MHCALLAVHPAVDATLPLTQPAVDVNHTCLLRTLDVGTMNIGAITMRSNRRKWALLIFVSCLPICIAQENATNVRGRIMDRSSLPKVRAWDYEFSALQVDNIEGWLRWFGIALPVDSSGEISGWLWVQRSERGWFRFSGYRLEGEISSPSLLIEQWQIRNAKLRFGYENENWYVRRLEGSVTPRDALSPAGDFAVEASLPTSTPQTLTVSGTVNQVNLQSLATGLALQLPLENRGGSLVFRGSVPFARASDLRAWESASELSLTRVLLPKVQKPVDIVAHARTRDGDWTVHDAHITFLPDVSSNIRLLVDAGGQLQSPWPFVVEGKASDVQVSGLLSLLGISSWETLLSGALQLSGHANGDAVQGIQSARAQARSNLLTVSQHPIRDINLTGTLANQSVHVELVSARTLSGALSGLATWNQAVQSQAGVPNYATFSFRDIQLEMLNLPEIQGKLAGTATGEIQTAFDFDANERVLWGSSGNISVQNAAVFGTSLGNVQGAWSKETGHANGEATMEAIKDGGRLQARAAVTFADRVDALFTFADVVGYHATGSIANYRTLISAPASVAGMLGTSSLPISASGEFDVRGQVNNWFEAGVVSLQNMQREMASQPLSLTDALLEFNSTEFRLSKFTLQDALGHVMGAASVRRDGTGKHLLRLLAKQVAIQPYWSRFAPRAWGQLGGYVNAFAELTVPASEGNAADYAATFDGTVDSAYYQNTPVGNLSFDGRLNNGIMQASANGALFGGTMELTLQLGNALEKFFFNRQEGQVSWNISGRAQNVDIRSLWATQFGQSAASQIAGTLSLGFDGKFLDNSIQSLSGDLTVQEFLHRRERLAQNLVLRFDTEAGRFRLTRLEGRLAGGSLEASGWLDTSTRGNSGIGGDILYSVRNVDMGQLARFIYPPVADEFSGSISYRGRGHVGRNVSLVGSASATNSVVYDLPLQAVRGTLQLDFDRSGNFLNLVANDLVGTAIGGQFNGDVALRGGATYQLRSRGNVRRGKMEQLSRALGFDNIVGTGKFTAAFQVNSRDASSLNALNGQLQVDFNDGYPQSIPIISNLNRLVPLVQLTSTDITRGTMHARIGQGVLRIQDLLLNSEAFWLAANGSASLQTGGLDLQGILQTGGGIESQVSQQSVRQFAALLAPEVLLLSQLDSLLRNRTIYFRVRGGTEQPILQPRIAPTLARGLLEQIRSELLIAPLTPALISR